MRISKECSVQKLFLCDTIKSSSGKRDWYLPSKLFYETRICIEILRRITYKARLGSTSNREEDVAFRLVSDDWPC